MSIRLHFSSADLTRVTIADTPDRRWELLLSLKMLSSPSAPSFERWRTKTRVTGELRALAACPTPPREWTEAMRAYFHEALEPYWPRITQEVRDDRAVRTATMLKEGTGALLAGLHPSVRWRAPVLELHGTRDNAGYQLGGRGLKLVPSLFCQGGPRADTDRGGRLVLLYPLTPDPGWAAQRPPGSGSDQARLGALLGPTRAQVLDAIQAECTTTELGRRVGISIASASYHASILRAAGLVDTHRHGNAVQHRLTTLGTNLLTGRAATDPEQGTSGGHRR